MASIRRLIVFLVVLLGSISVSVVHASEKWERLKAPARIASFPSEFQQAPPESPDYMVDNTGNKRGVAPIKGTYNGPVWRESGSFEGYMKKLAEKKAAGLLPNSTTGGPPVHTNSTLKSRQGGSFWLPELGPLGKAPHAGDGYVFYRNVLDYGADNTGATNTEEAINAAIVDGDRCGEECGNTFVLGALIYFPPGTYKVCTPIIQYYLTQFVGDPHDRPIIKGCDEFTGIALMDVDPYVPNQAQPDGTGVNWYINQNQFFRQIRNFVFDLTDMPAATDEHDQKLVPTGIHWQVSQACSLQNLLFRMPTGGSSGAPPTHVGIFTENGSGGFVSDLEFEGGAIGWRVGSQQYTATSLKFRNCITAVQMVWDWGFNWHKIDIEGGSIAFNISGRGGIDGQGIGSVSIIDSTVSNVPIGILTNNHATAPPNIVIDNTAFNNVGAIVIVEGGETLLEGGTTTVALWAHGRRYIGGNGERVTGHVENRPTKPAPLLDGSGKLFTRLRPQYEDLPASAFLVATQNGCSNDGTGDNTAAINAFLQQAAAAGQVAYFPAGIYSVQGTVTFPTGSKIQGSGWSQIQATGSYFADMENPKVVVRVGEEGDVGTMEIVDMLFTVKGATAGAIMMEWNVHESSQGAAGLWDSHIRVGGGIGTDLDVATCPKFSEKDVCICVSLLLHVTKQASGYFENFWAWVADHDNDMSLYWELDSSKSQIALFGARGVLVESQGPVWIYGSGSEHVIFYQYEMLGAKNVYLGHIQTESPYFQPKPVSPSPMEKALGVLPGDPDWSDCTKETCEMAWGLRILDSEGVMLHSAGLYSWFNNYGQACLVPEDCQQKAMEVRGSKDVSIFNIFSKAVEEIGTGNTDDSSIQLSDGNQQGYTSEISFWFPEDGEPGGEVIYIGPEVYTTHTAQCASPPCIFVMPPTTLPSQTTITVDPYTTELEVGASQGGTFVVTTTTVTITIGSIVTDVVPVSNHNVTRGEIPGAPFWVTPRVTFPPTGVPVTKPDGVVTTRNITLPPWPQIINWPGGGDVNQTGPGPTGGSTRTSGGTGRPTTRRPITTGPQLTVTFPDSTYTAPNVYFTCPPNTHYVPEYDAMITLNGCDEAQGGTTLDWNCPVTATVEIDEPTTVDFQLGCTRWTGTSEPIPTMTEFPPGYELEWVEEDDDDDDDDQSTCRLWFFFICIDWGRVKIGGWRWNFPGPVVIIGPPPIKWPSGVTIKGTLPGPWPPITIGKDGKPTIPPNQPTNCETQEAELCSTSTFISTTVRDGTTSTITSSATTTCDTIRGCIVVDGDYDTTSTRGSECGAIPALRTAPPVSAFPTLPLTTSVAAAATSASDAASVSPSSSAAPASIVPESKTNTTRRAAGRLARRAEQPPPAGRDHAMIWVRFPDDPEAIATIRGFLTNNENDPDMPNRPNYGDYKEVKANGAADGGGDWTVLFFVPNMKTCHIADLRAMRVEVADAYGVYDNNQKANSPGDGDSDGDGSDDDSDDDFARTRRQRRADVVEVGPREHWEISQISVGPGEYWDSDWETNMGNGGHRMYYDADMSFGKGQTIFVLEDDIWDQNSEFNEDHFLNGDSNLPLSRPGIRKLPEFDWGDDKFNGQVNLEHGTAVASKVTGWELGLAKQAQIIVVRDRSYLPEDPNNMIWERHLEKWLRVYNEVKRLYAADPSQQGKIVVTTSYGFVEYIHRLVIKQTMLTRLYEIFKKLEDLDVVIVAAAHNNYRDLGNDLSGLPLRFGDPSTEARRRIDSLIVVGGVDAMGRLGAHTPYADWLVMAPAYQLFTAEDDTSIGWGSVGNSFAGPLIAGLVAYWRGLPDIKNGWGDELKKPANVKKLLLYMQRAIEEQNLPPNLDASQVTFDEDAYEEDRWDLPQVPFIWTGMHNKKDCLVNPDAHPSCPDGSLSNLEPFGAGCMQPGTPDTAGRKIVARAGGVCVLRPGSGDTGSNGPGPGAIGDPITYSPGPASPTCVPGSPGCGTLCTGYYCVPSPTGFPPDRWDPEDPAHRPTTRPPITSRPPVTTEPMPTIPPESTCASYTPTTICNGSGGHSVCVTSTACATATMPTLPPDEDGPYSGPGCASYTSTTVCNGSGGRSVCVTDKICMPTPPPCPAWPVVGTPVCPPDFPVCLRTTTAALCAKQPAQTAAPAAIEARQTSVPTQPAAALAQPTAIGRFRRQQVQQQHEQKEPKPAQEVSTDGSGSIALDMAAAVAADDVSINNSTGVVARSQLLGVRQSVPVGCGGHETGGCTSYVICQKGTCASIQNVSCVQAFVHITMHPIDSEVTLDVYEDGVAVCSWSIKCLTISAPGCLTDLAKGEFACGNGNKIAAWGNGLSTVDYVSSKTNNRHYMLYLGQDGGDQYYPCQVLGRLVSLCIDSDWSASEGLCRSSAALLDSPPRRLELDNGTNTTVPTS